MLFLATKNRMTCSAVALLCVSAALLVDNTVAREGSATREDSATRYQETSPARSRPSSAKDTSVKDIRRLREGTVISDQGGYFREDGDGATFVADDGMEFGALPNLNLERVVRLLKNAEEPSSIRWSVAGKVTEFSGRNFLLVSRAVYKSAAPPPVPDRVGQ